MLNRQKNLIKLKLKLLDQSVNSTFIVLHRRIKIEKNNDKHTRVSVYINYNRIITKSTGSFNIDLHIYNELKPLQYIHFLDNFYILTQKV